MNRKSKRRSQVPSISPKAAETPALAHKLDRQAQKLHAAADRAHRAANQLHRDAERTHQRAERVHRKANEVPANPRARTKASPSAKAFPIVGIGSSAGGLEATLQLLKDLPANTGMAFVAVQHLDPTHDSALAALLARATAMKVVEARDNARLQPNYLYVITPGKFIRLAHRHLKVTPRRDALDGHAPVDYFFKSLADEEGGNAIGVILSGNGNDGTQGLLAVKAAGGITFAQEERTAKYPAMPGNAIAAGCVDFVLSPEKINKELRHIAGHLIGVGAEKAQEGSALEEKAFQEILGLLRQRTSVDFTYYKHATLHRRIQRRMVLHKIESLKEYGEYLRSHPADVKELFNDLLIHVTGFFRDAAVFAALRKKYFPRLLKGKSPGEGVRVWVPGCSTGEEVYSIAMTLAEAMNETKLHLPVQIFGTDINEAGLEKARTGNYPDSVRGEISADRLRRFFVKTENSYRVTKTLREMCIFARQNLTSDPPFSNLDMVSCRNLLIYLGPALQRKIMPVFHYALRQSGLLMLGSSETIGSFAESFSLIDKKAKIYAKKGFLARTAASYNQQPEPAKTGEAKRPPLPAVIEPGINDVQKQADRIVLTNYSLPGVIINKHLDILQFRGRTGLFLEHSHGEATLSLLKMAREGLALDLRSAVAKAIKQNGRIRHEGARVRQNGHFIECSIEVVPFSVPPGTEKFFLVMFEPSGVSVAIKPGGKKSASLKPSEHAELARLREELGATRESLQTIIEEQEATNEELRSANEEIMSSNEELQSTNEELETAKEELQSTNEELTTLNDELEARNTELEVVNNDLHNLLASVNIPVMILGADLRIRRFTAMAEKMFKLLPGDIGRPVTDINLPLEIPGLDKLVLEVFDSLQPKELETRDRDGRWWSVRIRPYKTTDHKIDGAVVALVDVNAMKSNMERTKGELAFADAIVNTVREPLLVLNQDLAVTAANNAFYRTFKVTPEQTARRHIYELGNGQWDIPQLRILLEEILPRNSSFENFEVQHTFPKIGKKRMLLNARRLDFEGDGKHLILLAIQDIPTS